MAMCINGHSNADGAAFCASCGVAMGAAPMPPVMPPAPPLPPMPPVMPPAPPAYGQPYPSYGQPYGAQPRNGFGIAALVLGIVSLVCVSGYGVLSVLAIIFGALGMGRANRGEATNKTMAMWGMILGIVGIVIGIIVFIALLAADSGNYRY